MLLIAKTPVAVRPELLDAPLVSFDLGLGDIANSSGYTYSYDEELVRAAAQRGGLSPATYASSPFVVKLSEDFQDTGATISNTDVKPATLLDQVGQRIELYTANGTGAIPQKVVGHESSHMAALLNHGDSGISERAKIGRKVVAVIGSLLVGGMMYKQTGGGYADAGVALLSADISASLLLEAEYKLRLEEIKAKIAEIGLSRSSILIIEKTDTDSDNNVTEVEASRLQKIAYHVGSYFKDLLIPNFNR